MQNASLPFTPIEMAHLQVLIVLMSAPGLNLVFMQVSHLLWCTFHMNELKGLQPRVVSTKNYIVMGTESSPHKYTSAKKVCGNCPHDCVLYLGQYYDKQNEEWRSKKSHCL